MSDSLNDKRYSGFWPLLILSASYVLLLFWQTTLIYQQGGFLAQQLKDREATVQQAKATQGDLEKLVRDLLDLAKRDDQAKAIVDKYKIRENAPAADATLPTPAPATAPAATPAK